MSRAQNHALTRKSEEASRARDPEKRSPNGFSKRASGRTLLRKRHTIPISSVTGSPHSIQMQPKMPSLERPLPENHRPLSSHEFSHSSVHLARGNPESCNILCRFDAGPLFMWIVLVKECQIYGQTAMK